MKPEFTSQQQIRVDFLLDGWDSIESFAQTLSCVESSTEIHEFVRHYNWDYGLEPLKLILTHPLCDRGTALEIYWLCQPDYYTGFTTIDDIPSCNVDGYLFFKFVESLLNENCFQHNNIHFDPMANYFIEKQRYLAKYSGIPDELLLPNYGDVATNKERLRSYREAPDDAEALDFLANKYLNSRDYIKALDCVESLISLDPESQRNWYIKISILEDIEKGYESENLTIREASVRLYPNIERVREDLVECYYNSIELYRRDLKGSDPNRFAREQIIEARENIAKIYLRNEDYHRAIETLEIILEQVKIEPVMGIDVDYIVLSLAQAYRELQDYDRALSYIDIFLEKIPKFEYRYSHKLIILKRMGRLEEAENLLNQMLESIDKTIEQKRNSGTQESAYFYQKSRLLEEYREDFRGAADSLQKIIDLKLYYNNEDRYRELLSKIETLRAKSMNLQ